MCGIVGYFEKGDAPGTAAAVGFRMLNELSHRGPDSVGMAIYGISLPGRYTATISLGTESDPNAVIALIAEILSPGENIENILQSGDWLSFDLPNTTDTSEICDAIASLGADLEVVSVGRRLSIAKQVGSPNDFEDEFQVSALSSTHILGHTRLSTESKVDLGHSQPFWGHVYPDLAIVHNGHITNYHQLRRQYQQKGKKFYTENDSEIIAIYLGERLRKGESLETALDAMLHELDGSYSCLASTDSEFGYVRDRFAFKPLVFAENDEFVALATEEIAVRAVIANDCEVREANAKEVRVWRR